MTKKLPQKLKKKNIYFNFNKKNVFSFKYVSIIFIIISLLFFIFAFLHIFTIEQLNYSIY